MLPHTTPNSLLLCAVYCTAGGYAGAPAGPSELLDDEAAPLRFKGTTPVRRGRTAVPGGWVLGAAAVVCLTAVANTVL
jgi:hypothetical protein